MILFRVDASSEIGYGHLVRCICLGEYFRKRSLSCIFVLIKSDQKAFAILAENGMDYLVIEQETDIINVRDVTSGTISILDVNNKVLFNDSNEYRSYISFLKENEFTVVSFEEFSEDIFPSDLVIIPYVGAEKLNFRDDSSVRLLGPSYFVFRNEFLSSPKVNIDEKVSSIFICMGGSDADQLTEKYLNFLVKSKVSLDIKIVFTHLDVRRKEIIQEILSTYMGSWEIILNPPDIADLISSSDIGLVNSGLIKYETSILGLPCLSISNNPHHEMVMKYFSEEGSILHLGLSDSVTESEFIVALSKLIENVEIREKLNQKCKDLFDGKGIQRIYDCVVKLDNESK